MDNNKFGMNYFSPITDHVVSQDGFQAILDLADDGYYNNQTRSANFGQSPEAISRLDDTNPVRSVHLPCFLLFLEQPTMLTPLTHPT